MRKRLVSMIMAGTLAMSMALTGCTSGGGTTTAPDTGSTGDTGAVDTGDTGNTADTPVESSGELIKVGVVNNPPSESGYREANVKDMEAVFSEAN